MFYTKNDTINKYTMNTFINKLFLGCNSIKTLIGMAIVHSAKQNVKEINKRLFLSPIGNIFDKAAINAYKKKKKSIFNFKILLIVIMRKSLFVFF